MGTPTEEFGPYIVYEQLGLGGMATVHRAATRGIAGFSKQVALKRMLPNVAVDDDLVRSFIREAQLASQLHHANIAQTYDLGKVDDTYFIAMELVQGRNLRELVKRCAAAGDPMPLPVVLNIACQICDALDYAHNLCDESGRPLGIIHRDVSPSNIIVGEAGVVKLIDFGIAKASAASGMHTSSGTIKGKFSYMAPEYLKGVLDARADLFAFGVILHELLANRPLFQGKDDMDTLYRVKEMKVLPPSRFNAKVPRELDAIVMTALERDPDARWQRANAIRDALTTEAKQLGLLAHNGEVFDWVRETFGGDAAPTIALTPITESLSVSDALSLDTNATEVARGAWTPDADETTSASPGLDDPTRLVRGGPKRAPSVVARITPVPRATPRDLARTVPVAHRNVSSKPSAPVLATDDDLDGVTTLHGDDPLVADIDGVASRTLPGTGAVAMPLPAPPRARAPSIAAAPRPTPTPASTPAPVPLPHVPTRPVTGTGVDERSALATTIAATTRPRSSNYMLAVFVLVAAAGAAAVVYFALPYLT